MFFDNPMYFFAFAIASLVLFVVLSKLGVGYVARWITAGVALFLWWTAAGGPVGMWTQAYETSTSLVQTIRSMAPDSGSPDGIAPSTSGESAEPDAEEPSTEEPSGEKATKS